MLAWIYWHSQRYEARQYIWYCVKGDEERNKSINKNCAAVSFHMGSICWQCLGLPSIYIFISLCFIPSKWSSFFYPYIMCMYCFRNSLSILPILCVGCLGMTEDLTFRNQIEEKAKKFWSFWILCESGTCELIWLLYRGSLRFNFVSPIQFYNKRWLEGQVSVYEWMCCLS